jgi:ferredoxin
VSTVIKYLEKLEELQTCSTCHQPVYRLRRRGAVEVKSQATFDRLDANFEQAEGREMASAIGKFTRQDPRSKLPVRATLAIDTRDCIGCDVCVAHCDKGVLKMVDGKALIDLRHLNNCDMDGTCVEVCPTDVVTLLLQPVETPPAAKMPLPLATPVPAAE